MTEVNAKIDKGATNDTLELTLTLRGRASAIVETLVNGFTAETLTKIRDAMQAEVNRHHDEAQAVTK